MRDAISNAVSWLRNKFFTLVLGPEKRTPTPSNGRKGWLKGFSQFDSVLDAGVAESWERTKDSYNAASSWFSRMRLHGFPRLVTEVFSELATLGMGGLVVLYGLAIPTMLEVDESNLLSPGKYSVKFLDKYGTEIGRRGINLDDAVKLEDIPDYLVKALLATEDRRFYEHFGVDVIGTFRALMTNLQHNEVVQGGSTLTQQLAKNLFLSSERSIQRKVKEVFLSLWLEARLTKSQILKLYLDRAYMGGGAFGVEAAAQFYFGKHVKDVTLAEAAMMAGLFKAPTKYAPHVNLPAARARANDVLSNLVDAGYYTEGAVHDARLHPAQPIETRQSNSPDWFLDWAYEEIQRMMDGKGQFVITARTTIDLGLQEKAEQALAASIRTNGRAARATSGAIVSMSPDGAVRAMVGGLDYGESQFNRATHAHRQPGSSFKLYVYSALLEFGDKSGHQYTIHSIFHDSAPSCGNWSPRNFHGGGSGGSVSMEDAFRVSLNTVAVDASFRVGRERVIEMAEKLGVPGVKKTCSIALGDGGVTPLEHTGAYATFANGGKLAKPYAVTEVTNSRGEVIYSRDRDEPPPAQVVSRRTVEQMNQMMKLVVDEGTGKRAALDFTYAVGKTGTASSFRDAWFMGFTGLLVTGVWIGNDDFRPMNDVTGGTIPASTWNSYMSVAHWTLDFPPIPGIPPHPRQIQEHERLAEIRRTDPALSAELSAAGAPRRNSPQMPEAAREILKRLVLDFSKASGRDIEPIKAQQQQRPQPGPGAPATSAPATPAPAPVAPGSKPSEPGRKPGTPPDRRAEGYGPDRAPADAAVRP